MAKEGRPAQPTALTKAKGTVMPSRLIQDPILKDSTQLITKANIPYPPEDFSESEAKVWNTYLFDMVRVEGWLLKTDLTAFADLCRLTVEAERLRKVWQKSKHKEVVFNDKGTAFANPTYRLWLEMEKMKQRSQGVFGLTPSDRTRITLAQSETKEEEEFEL